MILVVDFLDLAEKGAETFPCWASSICTKYLDSLRPIIHLDCILLKFLQRTTHVLAGHCRFLTYCYSDVVLLLPPFLLLAAC